MEYHCLKRYKDGGICQSMTGKIFWSFVYVEDTESGWSETEKQRQQETNLAVIQYLKNMAKQEHVNLQMISRERTGKKWEMKEEKFFMIRQYKDKLSEPKSLTVNEMQKIHEEMIQEIGNDPDALELYEELMAVAGRYGAIRAGWQLLGREEKMEQDSRRTSCHNSVITHFNMLTRYLRQRGKTAAWRDCLGYEEEDPYNRKRVGDFACYLVFVSGINAR